MAAAFVFFGDERRRQRVFRPRMDISHLSDIEIIQRYRLSRECIDYLLELMGEHLERRSERNRAVPPLTQILIGLRYLAKGDFYSEVGDLHGVSKSTVSRVLGSFLDVLNEQLDNIKFPISPEERQAIKLEFYQKSRIPGVIGAIDGTFVPIIGPHENEEVFRSRKGFHALNVQAVVDTKTIFRDVVSRWPGSVHDSAIFNNCGLKQYLETQQVGCLLGDSGYGLKTFLLTPKLNPITQQEVRYNAAHRCGRVVVERAFGMLKSRFRCLHKSGGCLPFQPQRAAKVVVACMRLHNLCVQFNVAVPQMNDTDNDEIDDNIVGDGIDVNAKQARQLIIDRF